MLALQVLVDKPEQVKPINANKVQGKSKMTDKTKLALTEENKAQLVKDVEQGSAIVINIKGVEGGSASITISTYLTGTKEERETDIHQNALSLFTNAMAKRIKLGVDTVLPSDCVHEVIRVNPKLVRHFEPNLPEEALKVFDEAENYESALEIIKERDLMQEDQCNCPKCQAEAQRKENSEEDSTIH